MLTKNLPRNQKGKNSEQSLKLVDNLGTDFRIVAKFHKSKKKKTGGKKRQKTHPPDPTTLGDERTKT